MTIAKTFQLVHHDGASTTVAVGATVSKVTEDESVISVCVKVLVSHLFGKFATIVKVSAVCAHVVMTYVQLQILSAPVNAIDPV